MATPRCVVFDMDDTLYLERDYVRSGFRAVSAEVERRYGLTGFFDVAWSGFESGVRGNAFDLALDVLGVKATEAVVRELVGVYRDHRPNISLLEDAARCLAALKRDGVRLALITDGPLNSQIKKVEALGLANWMDPILFTEQLGAGRSKPHVDAYQRIELATGFSGSECCYIGDNPLKDFVAPRELGWQTIRVRRPFGLHAGVESRVDAAREIPDLGAWWVGAAE